MNFNLFGFAVLTKLNMNGYILSRRFFDFAFEHSECKCVHAALFMWIVELNNRLGWKPEFGIPTADTMEGLSIGDKRTYLSALRDLNKWGFINIVSEAKNQYQASKISIVSPDLTENDKTYLDSAVVNSQQHYPRHTPQHNNGTTHGTPSGIPPIDKPLNNETINQQTKDVDAIRVECNDLILEKKSNKKKPPSCVSPPTLHAEIRLMIEGMNEGYYWQAKDGKAVKNLINKMTFRWKAKHKTDPADIDLINSFKWVLDNLPDFYKNKWDTTLIDSKFEPIIKEITDSRNGKSDPNKSATGISPRLQSVWQRIVERHSGQQA